VLAIDSDSCIVRVEDRARGERGRRLVALLGVTDLVVIDSGDAPLICPRSRVQEVKKVVDALRTEGKSELV